jgi:NAD(P)-dependent dehydrogenase (short-subunit alcohol dehydrogenase family)
MTQISISFKNKSVFIAGGSSGINLGIAEAFAKAGAKVAICSRSPERVAVALAQLRLHGTHCEGYSADVRDYASIFAALQQARDAIGAFDVLVSGAAGNFLAPALGMSANGFKTVVDIDLNGTFHVLRAGFEHLKKPGASVISISAPQAFNPTPFQAHVCAAKAGVDMLTRVLAMEWGADGVRVNSIVPGPIADTEGIRRLAPTPQTLQAMTDSVPLKRMGTLSDIANMALFLGSQHASFVTGAIIPVDGGSSLAGGRDFSSAFQGANK